MATYWTQQRIKLPPYPRGFHLITDRVLQGLPELGDLSVGMLNVFIQHTSASLALSENADPDVPIDLERAMNVVAPEDFPYRHVTEGRDDMPAHVKNVLLGSSLMIPIHAGRLGLGTWQGIYLCEHRDRAESRWIMMTAHGLRIVGPESDS